MPRVQPSTNSFLAPHSTPTECDYLTEPGSINIPLLPSGGNCHSLEKHMEMTGDIPAWPVRKIVERYLKQTGRRPVLFLPAFCGPYEVSFREKGNPEERLSC